MIMTKCKKKNHLTKKAINNLYNVLGKKMDFSTREISKSDEGHSWKPHLHTLVMGDRVYSSLDHGKPHLHALLMEDRMYSSQDHGFVYSRPVPHCSKALHSHTIITRRRLSHKMKERQIASVPLTGNMSLWIIKGPWNLQNLLEIINEVTK